MQKNNFGHQFFKFSTASKIDQVMETMCKAVASNFDLMAKIAIKFGVSLVWGNKSVPKGSVGT
jgi:hypothetical protein